MAKSTRSPRTGRKSLFTLLLIAALAITTGAVDALKPETTAALKGLQRSSVADVIPGRYIVEFDQPPAIPDHPTESIGSPAAAKSQHQTFSGYLASTGLDEAVKVDKTYSHVFNGAAITVTEESQLLKVAAAPGVKAVHPVFIHSISPIEKQTAAENVRRIEYGLRKRADATPQMVFANNMTGVSAVQTDLGLTGKGIYVGVVDSGIDYLHPAFWVTGKQCTQWKGDGCRVVDGKDFVGDDYNTRDPKHNVPNPGPTPMDCGGHGTHVAGIIGGKDETFTGVAPDVTYYAARVFGCDGSTATDVIVDAIETTFLAGVDLLNMSLGGGASFNDYVESKVVDKLSRRGLLVASALGNDGTKGLFQASSPGLARQGLGVGSFDNAYIKQDVLSVNGVTGLKEVPYTVDSDIKVKFALETPLPIKRTPNAVTAADDACTPFPAGTFKDAVALVQRGTCTFAIKAANAVAAGAKGVIVFNNRAGSFSGGLSDPTFPVPVGFIGQDAGKAIYAAADGTNQVSLVFHEDAKITLPNPTGGQPSDFSSWGVDPTLLIKPDIAAPGGLIYSSWPLKKGGHNTISGTSMATPFTAGVLALYLEKNPKGVKFETVRTRLQNTARPALYPAAGLPWPVAKQGPGLVDALAFITTQQTVSPSRIELGDSPALDTQKQTTLTIQNTADKPVTYNLLHQQAVSVFGEGGVAQDKLQYSTKGAKVTIQPATITVGPNKSAQFTVTVQPHAGGAPAGHWLLSGYVVLESDAASAVKSTLRVPYAIMKGDYSTYPQIPDPATAQLPLVSAAPLGFWNLTGNPPDMPMYDDPSTTTDPFTLKGLDKPVILATSQLITRLQVISLIDAKTGNKLGYLPAPQEYIGNGAYFAPDSGKVDAKTGKEIYGWDGTYFKTAEKAIKGADKDAIDAPNGAYYWQLELTAPSTNIDNYVKLLRPVWKSPKIVIDRNYVPPSTTSTTAASSSTTAVGTASTTATGTASTTATGSQTGSATATSSQTATGTATATGSASSTLSGTATAPDQTKTTGTGSATATATTSSGSATATATGTASGSATITGTASGSATITGTATATTTQSPGTTVIPCPPCPGGTKTVIIIQPTATVTTTVAPCPVCPGGTKTVIIVPPTQTVTQTVTPQPTMTTVPCNVCPGGIKTVIIIPPVGTQTDVCTIEPTHTVVPCKDANTCPPSGSTTQVIVQPTVPASPTTAGPAPTVTTEPCGKCPGGVKTIIIVPPTGTQTAPATVTPTNTVVPCNECNGGVKTVIVIPPPAQPTVTSTVTVPESPAETTPVPVGTTPAPVPVATQPADDSYGELEVPEEPIASKPKRCHRKKTQQRHYTMAAY